MQNWNEKRNIQIERTIEILNRLKQANISFVILRNYEFLSHESEAAYPRDLDILIPINDLDKGIQFLKNNGYIGQRTLNHYGFFHFSNQGIPLDIQVGSVCERNIPYLSFSDISPSISEIEEVPVLAGGHFLIHLVIHCLINKGIFNTEYQKKITLHLAIKSDKDLLSAFLIKFFRKSTANFIINNLTNKNFKKLSGKRGVFVFLHTLRHIKSLSPFGQFVNYKLSKSFPKKGKSIAIIGLDGTGKTTLAEAVVGKLRERNIKSDYLYMGRKRGHALPMHAISKKIGMSQLKLKKKKPNALYLIGRDGMYVLDMFFRYFKFILPNKISNHIVVCDRYAYSLYLDRNQTFVSRLLIRFFYPKPDVLIFIDTPEEEIIRRKDEYSKEERMYLLKRWMHVVKIFKADVIVSQDLKKMVGLVLGKLWLAN